MKAGEIILGKSFLEQLHQLSPAQVFNICQSVQSLLEINLIILVLNNGTARDHCAKMVLYKDSFNCSSQSFYLTTTLGDWLNADGLGCYKFLTSDVDLSWIAAQQKCEEIGGYLAEPHTLRFVITNYQTLYIQ
jgi:hypothetical protein